MKFGGKTRNRRKPIACLKTTCIITYKRDLQKVFLHLAIGVKIMARIKVKNVPGTTGKTPPYPYQDYSWLEYWGRKTNNTPTFCARCGCLNWAKHGSHVKKCDDPFDQKTYIVPLCADCNNPNNTDAFYVDCDLCPAE